jgi:hypothetical protein
MVPFVAYLPASLSCTLYALGPWLGFDDTRKMAPDCLQGNLTLLSFKISSVRPSFRAKNGHEIAKNT